MITAISANSMIVVAPRPSARTILVFCAASAKKGSKDTVRKGLFTLTQLAHTFRPRRRGKRSDTPSRVRDHALHALAIRDKTIYVLGQPKLPTASIRIYLDI